VIRETFLQRAVDLVHSAAIAMCTGPGLPNVPSRDCEGGGLNPVVDGLVPRK